MNTSSMRRNSQWTAVAAGLALVVAVTAYVHAQSTWSVTDRGTLGGTRSGLWSINNRGVAVGWSLVVGGRTHAMRWSVQDGMRDLGTLPGTTDSSAWGINDAGDIVGQSWSQSEGRAFLWTSAGGMVDIGPFSSFKSAAALGINSARTVVGNGTTTAGSQRAFIWTPGGEMQDLGTLGGNSSGANDINDAGQVVGGASPLSGGYHAFVWTASGGMIDLDPLGGNSVANRINNRGEIVGYRVVSNGIRAFLWTPAGGMVDLGEGQATGLNDVGQVVGESGRPFVWTSSGGRMPLPEIGPLHSSVARDINNPGLAIGYGALAIGASHALLWCEARPPVITSATADPNVLWPPNHQMITVEVNYTVTGSCGAIRNHDALGGQQRAG